MKESVILDGERITEIEGKIFTIDGVDYEFEFNPSADQKLYAWLQGCKGQGFKCFSPFNRGLVDGDWTKFLSLDAFGKMAEIRPYWTYESRYAAADTAVTAIEQLQKPAPDCKKSETDKYNKAINAICQRPEIQGQQTHPAYCKALSDRLTVDGLHLDMNISRQAENTVLTTLIYLPDPMKASRELASQYKKYKVGILPAWMENIFIPFLIESQASSTTSSPTMPKLPRVYGRECPSLYRATLSAVHSFLERSRPLTARQTLFLWALISLWSHLHEMTIIWSHWAPETDAQAQQWHSEFKHHSRCYFNVITKLFDSTLITPTFYAAIFNMADFMIDVWTKYHLWAGAFSAQIGEHMMKMIKQTMAHTSTVGSNQALQVMDKLSQKTLILATLDAHSNSSTTTTEHPRTFDDPSRCSVCFSPYLSARGTCKSCTVIAKLDNLLEGSVLPPGLQFLKHLQPKQDVNPHPVNSDDIHPFHSLPSDEPVPDQQPLPEPPPTKRRTSTKTKGYL